MIIKRVFLAPMFLLLLWASFLALFVSSLDDATLGYQPEVFQVETSIEIPKTELNKPRGSNKSLERTVIEVILITEREKTCLIRNVFFEAGSEPHEGKIAVAQVTWNRVKYGRWGKDICQVVYAPGQFSWTSDLGKRNRPIPKEGWESTIEAVEDFINGVRVAKLERGMFFHATHVRPNWNNFAEKVHEIGNHIFYALK